MEQGTHEELIDKKGLYYRLWEMQQGNFKPQDKNEEIKLIESDEEVFFDENEISYT